MSPPGTMSASSPRMVFVPCPPRAAPRRPRAPAVPVGLSAAAGIALDRLCDCDLRLWICLSSILLCVWWLAVRREKWRAAAICLLLASAATGAAWHHSRWSLARGDHVAAYARDDSAPVRLTARIVDRPVVVPKKATHPYSGLPQRDRTLCTIACTSLRAGRTALPASGQARLEVAGPLLHAEAGDTIELVGRFSRPGTARNPGSFDFRRYLRASGQHAVVHCEEPDDVTIVEQAGSWWRRLQGQLRLRAERLLQTHLSERTAPVGTALLLGTRTGMPDELREAFAASGTTHILAISGANVGILALLLACCCRVLNLNDGVRIVLSLLTILGYAFIADAQPPVMRAVMMIAALLTGALWQRRGSLVNCLAVAALGVLAWNPAHLFDVGAQLSFLAVSALLWASESLRSVPQETPTPRPVPTRAERFGRLVSGEIRLAYVSTAAVWLFTLPLTLARFHLFSPIGFVINVLLGPLVMTMLAAGYALLLCGLLAPPSAVLWAPLFEWSLRGLLWLVEHAARVPYGHLHLPGPGNGWLLGFYACLAAALFGLPGQPFRRWGWRLMLAWCVAGLAMRLDTGRPPGLRCTFLSVGHGAAVLVELPGGRTLLYDAGQLQDGNRAQQTVQDVLWQRGIGRADVVVISHADVDHFNGVPGLSGTIGMDCVLVHPSFLDFRQPSVQALCDRLAERKIPIRLTWAGDAIRLDEQVSLRFLHPPGRRSFRDDNANSLVLAIEYAGRRILLAGDLEKDGLQSLLRETPLDVDVLLAPHHGSPAANPRALAEWALPEWVIVSGGHHDAPEKLRSAYGEKTQILSTHERGAVTFLISGNGRLQQTGFLPEPQTGGQVTR